MRSLARDIGIALGSAAHLAELRRTRSGGFAIEDARSMATVLTALDNGEDVGLIAIRDAVPQLPEVAVDATLEQRLRNGDSRALDGLVPPRALDGIVAARANKFFKVIFDGHLIAIAEATSRVTAVIARVFAAN